MQNDCYSGENRVSYESQNLTESKQFLETLCRVVLTESALIESLDYPEDMQDLFVEQSIRLKLLQLPKNFNFQNIFSFGLFIGWL